MDLRLALTPEEIRPRFFALQNRKDLVELLDVDEKHLIYYLYILQPPEQYITFQIPKKSGGFREISAPIDGLKIVQQKLNQVLQAVYPRKAAVHGFVRGQSIVSNAKAHSTHKYVLNVDLKDFFPSINFGRVRNVSIGLRQLVSRFTEVATPRRPLVWVD